MAVHSGKFTLRAKWLAGWALMRAGKASEGCELLSRIRLSDLEGLAGAEHPERIATRVRSIIERQPRAEADNDPAVMDILITAAKRGDHEASDLLVFGDLEELPAAE